MDDSLVVSYMGYLELVLPVSNNLILELREVPLSGETVVVTAQPLIAEEFQFQKISKLDIYTNPAAAADPILAVNSLPSATTTDESANISLRGSSPLETGIFLNNVPVYDAVRYSQLNGIGTFSIFNTDIIKDVSVFPGNPPIEFGNTTSGVIALNTDEMVLEQSSNSIVVSLASIGLSRQQRLNDHSSLKLFTNWQGSDAIKTVNERSLESIESFQSKDLGVYWYGGKNSISWKVLSYTNLEGYAFNFESPSYAGIFHQAKARSFLVGKLEKELNKGSFSFNQGLSYSKGEFSYSNVGFNLDKQDIFLGVNYHLVEPSYALKTGLSYDRRGFDIAGNVHQYPYALDINHPTIQLDETAEVTNLEGYGYFKYFLGSKTVIGTGFRKNIPNNNERSYLSKQLNISYNLKPFKIILGAGEYFKTGLEEGTGEFFVANSRQLSLDVKYGGDAIKGSLSLFKKRSEILDVDYNVSGVEILVEKSIGKLESSASLTLLDSKRTDDLPYQYDINYFVRSNLSYSLKGYWTIEGILMARQGIPFIPFNGGVFDPDLGVYEPIFSESAERMRNYVNVGISVSKIFLISDTKSVVGFLSLNNAFDRQNTNRYTYNFDYTSREPVLFSRRTIYFGAVINF
jgi:hypothetical protein